MKRSMKMVSIPRPRPFLKMIDHELPFGLHNLDPRVICLGTSPRKVRCFVRGCGRVLQTPTRYTKGEVCPDHGIRCHCSSYGATYSYADVRGNIIASPDLLATRIVHHPFKYESHRLGLERSEDAVSWNVFRSLQEAGCLGRFARAITGDSSTVEPFLYLWGICLNDDAFDPMELLISARNRFESNLPVERPLTEPDIVIHLPGRYLILIEAKFTSPNTTYERGPRKDAQSLTLDELLEIYHDANLQILDYSRARVASQVHYQLWRNMTFSEWMAREDHPRTKAFHVNLVRQGFEKASAAAFHSLVNPNFKERFRRLTWENIYRFFAGNPALETMRRYLETKTAGLVRAFRLPPVDQPGGDRYGGHAQ
jgi:hypothetical protein